MVPPRKRWFCWLPALQKCKNSFLSPMRHPPHSFLAFLVFFALTPKIKKNMRFPNHSHRNKYQTPGDERSRNQRHLTDDSRSHRVRWARIRRSKESLLSARWVLLRNQNTPEVRIPFQVRYLLQFLCQSNIWDPKLLNLLFKEENWRRSHCPKCARKSYVKGHAKVIFCACQERSMCACHCVKKVLKAQCS